MVDLIAPAEVEVQGPLVLLVDGDLGDVAVRHPPAEELGPQPGAQVLRGQEEHLQGVAGHTLEMLFLAPEHLGTGLGAQLFRRGMADCYIAQITVNEQNQRALDFYLRRSYKVHHRTSTDQQGRPYPLLYLTLSCY